MQHVAMAAASRRNAGEDMANRPYGCGIGPALEVVSGKWRALVLWELQ